MNIDPVHPAEIPYYAERAVNELIEDSASGKINENRALAEIIMACIRDTAPRHLEVLKAELNQRALDRPDLAHKHPDYTEPSDR